ncbi:RNA ligase/cyclic nucleotide phosphodiesterase [Achaetomium macrosporum]|uniref:RNA ligase/cyclic nucleotide phosphodiesterase n=1 Tax=Achaetomium macrosporum TaxID=79813 RepID=A0AAN7H944_9PEZI|nr:RNA ligase/cyclic nucleotide phosphodiesterase [Achaetomium macrosporum]
MPSRPPTQPEPQPQDQASDQPACSSSPEQQERPPYPIGVPLKFSPSGAVQPFAGNTILANLSPDWVCDKVRLGGHSPGVFWPEAVPGDAELAEVTALFAARLRGFDLGDAAPPYKMRIVGFSPLEVGIGVAVGPATAEEGRRIKGLRDRLARTLAIRHPRHDTYGLHVSLAYLLRHLSAEQEAELKGLLYGFLEGGGMAKEFELAAPEFCTFGNMFEFRRVFYVGEGEDEAGRKDGDE